jgi:hypothetical protein
MRVRQPFGLKLGILLTAAMAVALSLNVGAGQTVSGKPREPELVAVFFYLDPASQELKRVPAENWMAHGFSDGSIIVSGTGSPLNVANNRPEFIFQVAHPEYAKVFQFVVNAKKKQRQFELVKTKNRSRDSDPGMPVDITRYGDSSYRLTPQTPLENGEYALFIGESTLRLGSRLFTFSVGAP